MAIYNHIYSCISWQPKLRAQLQEIFHILRRYIRRIYSIIYGNAEVDSNIQKDSKFLPYIENYLHH